MTKSIKNKFEKIHITEYGLPKPAVDILLSISSIKHFSKGEDIVVAGKPDTNEYFIVEGVLREYIINKDGNEITINFYRQGVVTPNHCRTDKGISILSMQALTPCSALVADSGKLHEMRLQNKFLFAGLANLMTTLYKEKIQTQIIHISQPAIKRLEYFRDKFPGLENEVPNSYIASYLGITNVSLSRLRNKSS